MDAAAPLRGGQTFAFVSRAGPAFRAARSYIIRKENNPEKSR